MSQRKRKLYVELDPQLEGYIQINTLHLVNTDKVFIDFDFDKIRKEEGKRDIFVYLKLPEACYEKMIYDGVDEHTGYMDIRRFVNMGWSVQVSKLSCDKPEATNDFVLNDTADYNILIEKRTTFLNQYIIDISLERRNEEVD
ncbi:MAG: hypothetical protein PHC62_00825 [Candidatus Izemoplasmatales bacterium]|nr:hypothetical protein [Candidatus Izemoplasmatales bacterium]